MASIYDYELVNLDLKDSMKIRLSACKNDDIILHFAILDYYSPINIEAYSIEFLALKPDGTVYSQVENITKSGNEITINCNSQLSATGGYVVAQLRLWNPSDHTQKSSYEIIINVVSGVLDVDRQVSQTVIDTLDHLDISINRGIELNITLDATNDVAEATNVTLNSTISTGNALKGELDADITNGNALHSNLGNDISTGTTLKNGLDTDIATGSILKTDLESENTRAEADIVTLQGLDIVNEIQTARGGYANLDARLDNSDTVLGTKANDTDNARTTTDKTVTGAINELNSNKANQSALNTTNTNVTNIKTVTDKLSYATNTITSTAGFTSNTTINALTGLQVNSVNVATYGSNANGKYVKFYDGTMICYLEADKTYNMTTAYGAVYYISDTFTFPATFVGIPSVTSSFATTGVTWTAGSSISSTATTIKFVSGASTSLTGQMSYVAVGRWI